MAMSDDRNRLPEDVIREALDRATAAVLTLAMETVSVGTGHSAGNVSDATMSRVMSLFKKLYQDIDALVADS